MFSQNNMIDSLQQRLNQTRGSERILVLNDLAVAYWTVDLSKSLVLAQEALDLEEQLKFFKTKARTLNIIGVTYDRLKNYNLANDYYNQCLETANKYDNKDDIYKCLSNKIVLYVFGNIKDSINAQNIFKRYINMTIEKNNHFDFNQGLMSFIFVYHIPQSQDSMLFEYINQLKIIDKNNEFLSATLGCEGYLFKINNNYFKAIEKYELAMKYTEDEATKVSFLINIGLIYFEMTKYKESIQYFNDALGILKIKDDEFSMGARFMIEASLGENYLKSGDFKLALLSLRHTLNNDSFVPRDKGTVYNNLGMAYLSLDSLEMAEKYIYKAISLFDSLKIDEMKLASFHSLATLLIHKHQLIKLPNLINEISDLVIKVNDNYITSDIYSLLSDYYEKTGDYKKSVKYLKKWITVNDSILSKKNREKLNEFHIRYETEKKDQQIKLDGIILKNKNIILQYSLAGGSLILIALILIIILYGRKNHAYKLLVYQNLNNSGNTQQKLYGGDLMEANEDGIFDFEKYNLSNLSEEYKELIFESLIKLIENKVYIESGLTINNLAEKCGTNRTYLSIVINEKFHANFNSVINNLRIEEAKRILSVNNNCNIPLKKLYQLLGFKSYSTFNKAFKKCIGVTPAFYQKTVKKLQGISN